MPFDSDRAKALNRDMFETMYFAAMTASCELAEKEGPYETFEGSPLSKGIFQFDMWGEVYPSFFVAHTVMEVMVVMIFFSLFASHDDHIIIMMTRK